MEFGLWRLDVGTWELGNWKPVFVIWNLEIAARHLKLGNCNSELGMPNLNLGNCDVELVNADEGSNLEFEVWRF